MPGDEHAQTDSGQRQIHRCNFPCPHRRRTNGDVCPKEEEVEEDGQRSPNDDDDDDDNGDNGSVCNFPLALAHEAAKRLRSRTRIDRIGRN